jgi:SAM-dependent methyltransferase
MWRAAVSERATLAAVREQYEELPYPSRDPEDERRRLIQDLLSQPALLNHLFWGGRRQFDGDFRVLNAGCGTGDSTICLAEQLRGSGAQIVSLDLSERSLAVAAERARVRELDGIEFVRGSIEELPSLGLGRFDYVVAGGVLHHLASPAEGLRALTEVLVPDGGLGLMVYGRYGRTGVYHVQELLRRLAPADQPTTTRLRTARRLLGRLRPEHPARLYADSWERELEENGGPGGDAALVDLFLHPQDRAYTVPELYEWLAGAGLRLVSFDVPGAYDPRAYDPELDVARLAPPEQHALAELLHGRMGNHSFFAQPQAAPAAPLPASDDESGVPMWSLYDPEEQRARALDAGKALTVRSGVFTAQVKLSSLGAAILRRVDGHRSLGAILDEVDAAFAAVNRRRVQQEWERLYAELRGVSYLVLNPAPSA